MCDPGRLCRSVEPLILEALRNLNRGRYRSRGSAHTFGKDIFYFVIDLDCDSDTEPDPDTWNYDDKLRFKDQV